MSTGTDNCFLRENIFITFYLVIYYLMNSTHVGVLLNNNIKNLVASCDKSLYRYSNLYRTNVMFCLVSVSLAPRNGDIPESNVYAITPSDQISEYGYAGSSHKISGAADFERLINTFKQLNTMVSVVTGQQSVKFGIYLWTPRRCLHLQLLQVYWLSARIQSRLVWRVWYARKPSLCYPVADPNGHNLASVSIAIRLIPKNYVVTSISSIHWSDIEKTTRLWYLKIPEQI